MIYLLFTSWSIGCIFCGAGLCLLWRHYKNWILIRRAIAIKEESLKRPLEPLKVMLEKLEEAREDGHISEYDYYVLLNHYERRLDEYEQEVKNKQGNSKSTSKSKKDKCNSI